MGGAPRNDALGCYPSACGAQTRKGVEVSGKKLGGKAVTRERKIMEALKAAMKVPGPLRESKGARGDRVMRAVSVLVPDCTAQEIASAAQFLETEARSRAALWTMIQSVGKRHGARPNETIGEIVKRAAAAGDKEAIALLPRMKELRV